MENKDINAGEIENSSQVIEQTSHAVETGNNLGDEQAVLDCGKFNSVSELLNAYKSLEKEFTRRSQKIKELVRENGLLKTANANGNRNLGTVSGEIFNEEDLVGDKSTANFKSEVNLQSERVGLENAMCNLNKEYSGTNLQNEKSANEIKLEEIPESIKNGIIREYLISLTNSKPSVKLITGDGQTAITPPSKPKTLFEAGEIAKQFFKR